ncbi:hypothetical protein BDR26DRAFT_872661 [Obelidium mucronatum]|nr:hypothetical protein BDR26DRAFT_872661 [Obelidium mucronatum]
MALRLPTAAARSANMLRIHYLHFPYQHVRSLHRHRLSDAPWFGIQKSSVSTISPANSNSTNTTNINNNADNDKQPDELASQKESPEKTGLAKYVQKFRDGDFDPFGRFRRTFKELMLWVICASLAFDLRTLRQDTDDFKKTAEVKERILSRELDELRRVWDPTYTEEENGNNDSVASSNVVHGSSNAGGDREVAVVEKLIPLSKPSTSASEAVSISGSKVSVF